MKPFTPREIATLQELVCTRCARSLPHPDGDHYCLFGHPPDAWAGRQPLAWTRLGGHRIHCAAFTPRQPAATPPPPAQPTPPPAEPGDRP